MRFEYDGEVRDEWGEGRSWGGCVVWGGCGGEEVLPGRASQRCQGLRVRSALRQQQLFSVLQDLPEVQALVKQRPSLPTRRTYSLTETAAFYLSSIAPLLDGERLLKEDATEGEHRKPRAPQEKAIL